MRQKKKKARPSTSKKSKNNLAQEVSFIGKALRGLGALGGSTVGAMVGQPAAGSALGSSLGAALSKWMGSGDYTVARNTVSQRAAANIPMMHSTNQSVVIRHREFVRTINGSSGFAVQASFAINPGLADTFPWLASIAQRFQEYEFKGMVWHYVPTSGTFNGSNAALGAVMIQTSYRTTDIPPSSKVEMLNECWSNECVPYETMAHPIECDPKENPFNVHYVRGSPILTGEPLMYDVGRTFVATQGQGSTDVIGDLWCTYEVELKKPLVASALVPSPAYFAATWVTASASNVFAGIPVTQTGSMAVTATGRVITIPPGVPGYCFAVVQLLGTAMGSTGTFGWSSSLTSTNLAFAVYDGANAITGSSISGTSPNTDSLRIVFGFRVTDPTATATITLPAPSTTSGTWGTTSLVISTIA